MAEDDDQDSAEAEENACGDEAGWSGALDRQCQQEGPDRRGSVQDGGNAAGNGALAQSEESKGNCVVEEGDDQQRNDEAARRQLAPFEFKDAPEKRCAKGKAQKRNPCGGKAAA